MPLTLAISPHGRLFTEAVTDATLPVDVENHLDRAFTNSTAAGLLHLATSALQSALPPDFAFAREFARHYFTRLCHTPDLDNPQTVVAPLEPDERAALVFQAPPMKGLEYLTPDVLATWWQELDDLVRAQIRDFPGGAQAYLADKNSLWRLVGRITFHLVENKRDQTHPFAFMATYANRLSDQARVQHLPLARALQEYAGARNRAALLSLLAPIQRAAERSPLAKEWVDSGDIDQPLAWTPRDAYRFLNDLPAFEEAGIIVRVPDWWKRKHPPRPQVSVRIGEKKRNTLGIDALLDFSVGVTLDGQTLTQVELTELLASEGGLVRLKGQWVEVDKDKLAQALSHWKRVERDARSGGISFFDGMRLLAGADMTGDSIAATALGEPDREWTGIAPGAWLEQTLDQLRHPPDGDAPPPDLHAQLRPYQQGGVKWLRFLTRLGLGACLADDMGLGKTIQVIALLLHLKREHPSEAPSLLVVPASLIANWKAELTRFAPSLRAFLAHPSETDLNLAKIAQRDLDIAFANCDLIITTYGMLARCDVLRSRTWNLAILDEAQAIKNAGARQTAPSRNSGPPAASPSPARRSKTASAISGPSSTSSIPASSVPPRPSGASPKNWRSARSTPMAPCAPSSAPTSSAVSRPTNRSSPTSPTRPK